jgi:uncharacterized BrkB/YihY/UPF0761 family membrane protein
MGTVGERTRRWLASVERRVPRLGARVVEPSLQIADAVRRDGLGIHAGSLTYGAFLAIPPALLLTVSAASIVLANHESAQRDLVEAAERLIPGLEEVVTTHFSLATTSQLGLGLFGLLALLWAASGFAARARTALGVIFRTGHSGLLEGRLAGIAIGVPAFLGFVILGTVAGWALGLDAPWWVEVLAYAAVLAVGGVLFLLLYWALTPGAPRPRLREHVPGAIAFTIAGTLVERVGGAYVAYVIEHTTALYGAIGAVFGLLAFLYAMMWVFLLGAEVSSLSVRRRSARSG